ncbi:hypothetical protein BK142_24085 [Paenibacillus glucanolyticus]|nr:hypothetical protein BK142_24085 [Paenibacillus glucanolyticus]
MSKLYLFSYKPKNEGWTEDCVNFHLDSLYDIKHLHDRVYLIKTDDDVDLLDKYLLECFRNNDSYFLLQISEMPIRHRHQGLISEDISTWLQL